MNSYHKTLLNYVRIQSENGLSFGGNQRFFSNSEAYPNPHLASYGCGLVSVGDFLLHYYAQKETAPESFPTPLLTPDKTEYLRFLRYIRWHGYPISIKGSFGFQVPLYLNRFFRKHHSNRRVSFLYQNTPKKRLQVIKKAIQKNHPVILVLGRHFMHPGSKKGVTFYRLKNQQLIPGIRDVYSHFVNITGYYTPKDASLPLYLEVSSWGEKFYIDYEELSHFIAKESAPWISGIFYLK